MTADILEALAPCGLSCEKCFAHVDGDIRKYSIQLKEKLGNFEAAAKRFETLLDDPIFRHYPDFNQMLNYLARGSCRGCRHEQCKLMNYRPPCFTWRRFRASQRRQSAISTLRTVPARP
ncbi:MAG: DUF3795 domain-containing protein [Desulfobacteraceae bacterium]|nr:DUF3795 domain-containing protein [Desulfobacteraceae bacterium]